jgi:hypothetical protein
MARPKYSYSPNHDKSTSPSKPSRARKAAQKSVSPPSMPGPVSTQDFSLPPVMTEDFRRQLRARQLLSTPGDFQPIDKLHPLQDPDLEQDMEIQDPRGYQHNQQDGPVNTIFPKILGPQPRTKMRTLPKGPRKPVTPREKLRNRLLQPVAAVDADEQPILAFDNQMTVVHNSLRTLRRNAEAMAHAISAQSNHHDSAATSAKNIVQLISQVLEPWFLQVDNEFDNLLGGTSQGEALTNPQTNEPSYEDS